MAPPDSATNSLDIKTLLQLIPEFNTNQSNQIYRFVRSCDSAFKLASISQESILLIYALNKISGPGSSDVHCKTYDTWTELKEFLIKKFSQTKTIGHLSLELQNMFQKHNETVTDYYLRVDLCRNKMIEKLNAEINDNSLQGRIEMTEETSLSVFINGLNSDIGSMLRTKNFENLSDAGNFAIQEDKIRNMNKARQSLNRSGFNPSTRPIQNLPHRIPNFRPPPPRHIQQNQINKTFNPMKTCNYCKKTGHYIADCRKLAYNNSKTSLPSTSTNYKVNHLNDDATSEMGNSQVNASAHHANIETQAWDNTQNLNEEMTNLQTTW